MDRRTTRAEEDVVAAPMRTSREQWVQQGLEALAAGGPDAVSVERLANAMNVSKGGFYWQFSGRAELLTAMLDAWEHTLVDQVIDRVEGAGGDARDRLHSLFSAGSSPGTLLDVELAVREWARRDVAVAELVARVYDRRMTYMRTLFQELLTDDEEVEARCLLALTLFVGNRFVAAKHGRRSRRQVTAAAVRFLEH
jgi:AcrR family transcriptional regulator